MHVFIWKNTFEEGDEDIQAIYDSIRLPERATAGSAGYDFFAPKIGRAHV